MSIGFLLLKKFLPGEKRTWRVFGMDIGKQITSSGFAHITNMLLAMWLKNATDSGNNCVWYFTNFTCDCMFGIPLNYALFSLVAWYAAQNNWQDLRSGIYT